MHISYINNNDRPNFTGIISTKNTLGNRIMLDSNSIASMEEGRVHQIIRILDRTGVKCFISKHIIKMKDGFEHHVSSAFDELENAWAKTIGARDNIEKVQGYKIERIENLNKPIVDIPTDVFDGEKARDILKTKLTKDDYYKEYGNDYGDYKLRVNDIYDERLTDTLNAIGYNKKIISKIEPEVIY